MHQHNAKIDLSSELGTVRLALLQLRTPWDTYDYSLDYIHSFKCATLALGQKT